GVIGSILALLFVTNMPVYWLKWLVVLVVVYTSATMFKAAMTKDVETEKEEKVS
ncbi:MAG TPA: permease, partial [Terrisporobacter glycolicus]|nr:permease [Terrisporobacter hibernicus]